MELKCVTITDEARVKTVLIVPLWNWNIGKMIGPLFNASSNRTFMELKSGHKKGHIVST